MIETTLPNDKVNDPGDQPYACQWRIDVLNRRVEHDWRNLEKRAPDECARCFEYLQRTPTQRWPGRVYPLRGEAHQGIWRYEVTAGDRVYYVPEAPSHVLVIYYAGPGPHARAPLPPRELQVLSSRRELTRA